jgi:hypothetical protein
MSDTGKEDITTGVKDLSVAEPERIRSKNLDVLAEYRKVKRKNGANFVVIGKHSDNMEVHDIKRVWQGTWILARAR